LHDLFQEKRINISSDISCGGRRGRDRMVVEITTT